jgi:hypothetical protein
MNNAERTNRFEVAMLAIEDLYEDALPALLVEVLADARHWCDRHDRSFWEIDRQAHRHYLTELSMETPTQTSPMTQHERADADIDQLLVARRQIAAVWGVEDVQEVRPDLSDDQCWEVLQLVERTLDAEHGICWQTLEVAADTLFGEAPAEKEEGHE